MKKILSIIIIMFFVLFASIAYSADVTLTWDASDGAIGYKVYISVDNGVTWTEARDVENILICTLTNVPDKGLLLFKVSAYNANGEAVRDWSGAWFNGDWKLDSAGGVGIP